MIREDLSIGVSITTVGLILTKAGRFFFFGVRTLWVQTDGQTRLLNPGG